VFGRECFDDSSTSTTTTTTEEVIVSENCLCTEQYDPVCCRGETFGNACNAKCEGGFDVDEECSANACDEDCICTREYNPFCCDESEQFSNPCLARCGGYVDVEESDSCRNEECVLVGVSSADKAKLWSVVMVCIAVCVAI